MKNEHNDTEKQLARIRSPSRARQQWCRHYYAIPRPLRLLILTIVVLWFLIGSFKRIRDNHDYRLKVLPTDFAALVASREVALWHPEHAFRVLNGTHIDEKYIFMRPLGKGMEGSAAFYVDVASGEVVVVKTYTGLIRNKIPDHLLPGFAEFSSRWPVEIEAGLLLGNRRTSNENAYVPVRDYFVLQSKSSKWRWAMVTPFIESGTLLNLAEATKVHERTTQKLDKIFRQVLHKVLHHLRPLHTAGYCHDDVKPDNIFIANTTHWLLGDLGNVRHFDHPWHATGRWKRENQWADCELNDVRRLLKSYMQFLRNAGEDPAEFDRAFYAEEQAWSKLYWQYMRQPAGVNATLEMSKQLDSDGEPEWKLESSGMQGESECLGRMIDLELTCTTLHLRLKDRWPFRRC